jgi:leucyl/phenylalanyl-tRNA--protein transferase
MFHLERDASKVALVHLVALLRVAEFRLLDAQFMTEHLSQFGALEIPRAQYQRLLGDAVEGDAQLARTPMSGDAALKMIAQP